MKLFSRGLLIAAALCVALFVLQGCSQNPSTSTPGPGTATTTPTGPTATAPTTPHPGKKLVIGFSQIGSESDWRRAHTKNIREEAAKRGITLMFDDAQQKQQNQIRAIENFVNQKVDAIILAPVKETGWEPALEKAKAAGIPVILSDRGVKLKDPSLYVTLVGPDFVEEGRMAGRWLAKKTNGKCNIVELQGTTGSSPAIDRKKGFQEIISQYPGMKIIKSQTGDFKRTGGKAVMEAFIKAEGKNIQAVYAHNDDMALGAIEALKDAGMNPGKDVYIVSVDAVKAAFEAMIAGTLNATVECSPLLGPGLFDACEKAVNHEPLPKQIPNKEQLFDQSVAAQVIGTRKY